jgi:hypothetical protein
MMTSRYERYQDALGVFFYFSYSEFIYIMNDTFLVAGGITIRDVMQGSVLPLFRFGALSFFFGDVPLSPHVLSYSYQFT